MRIVSLNTWGARVYQPLVDFLKREAGQTDIFCFQEVYHTLTDRTNSGPHPQPRVDGLAQITAALGSQFRVMYTPAERGYDESGRVDFHLEFGNAMFVRKGIALREQDEVFVYQTIDDVEEHTPSDQPRAIQVSRLEDYTIINFHGLWQKDTNKQDTPARLEQSRRLREVMDRYPVRLILCGDFNLIPDGRSIAILEKGMKNLVKEYGITSTRSSLYAKPFRLADYILVSPDVEVTDFKVLSDEVSDHLPLVLELA